MNYRYKTSGTCSTMIDIDLSEDNIVNDVRFTGGCNGNLKGISELVKGQNAQEVIKKLSGIRCGFKSTSCPDQLAKALSQILNQK